MFRRSIVFVLCVLCVSAAFPMPARACWIYVPPQPQIAPVQLTQDHVEVIVRDQVALFTVRPTFHNPNPVQIEGTYFMEMEPGAEVSRFTMMVNGRETSAELLDAAKAKQIYQGIVSKMRDPALLEYYGSQVLQAKIFPIPANGDVHITVQYTQQLEANGGLVRVNALNTNPKANVQPLQQVSFRGTIESSVPIKSVFSPTHPVEVLRTSDRQVKVGFEQNGYLPKTNLTLYYTLANDDIGIHLLTGADDAGKKHFMLTCAPKVEWRDVERIPKDIVFVLDTSGSMAGEKMTQAKSALAYCVNRLRSEDRFDIVDFSTEARVYSETLVQAGAESRQGALKYVERLEARGGTAISDALEQALKLFGAVGGASGPDARGSRPGVAPTAGTDAGRLPILIFLTDGLPTVGERNPDAIVSEVKSRNAGRIRIFTFGVGYDVNTKLLDAIAADNGGARDYVAPNEDIEVKVSALYDKVSSPILTNVTVIADGVRLFDVYPRRMPDLFQGSQVVLFGRFEGEGAHEVTVQGQARGVTKTYRTRIDFSSPALRHDLVPRLWATRKVAFLLDDLRLHGGVGGASGPDWHGGTASGRDEVIQEIVALARQYGIVTPYTSYLITEDTVSGPGVPRPLPAPLERSMAPETRDFLSRDAAAPQAGREAVEHSRAMNKLSAPGGSLSSPAPSAAADARVAAQVAGEKGMDEGRLMRRIRHVGSKTFYAAGEVWYDSLFQAGDERRAREVKFMSDEYLKLLDAKPGLAKYLSLGSEIYVQFEGVWYHVTR